MSYKINMPNELKQDARVTKTRKKILDVGARVLFTDGWGAVTHMRLASETGIARGTIYRHWPHTDDLILEIFENCDPAPYKAVRVGELRADLIAELQLLETNLQNSKLGDVILNAAQYANENTKIKKIHQSLHKIIKAPFVEILNVHGFEENCADLAAQKLIAPILYQELFDGGEIPLAINEIVDELIAKKQTRV